MSSVLPGVLSALACLAGLAVRRGPRRPEVSLAFRASEDPPARNLGEAQLRARLRADKVGILTESGLRPGSGLSPYRVYLAGLGSTLSWRYGLRPALVLLRNQASLKTPIAQ